MQSNVNNWIIPKEIVIWISITLAVTLILTILIGFLWVDQNKGKSVHKFAGRYFDVPKDIDYAWLINLGGDAPIFAVQENTNFSYLDLSEGEPAIQLDGRKLPKDRAIISYIDRSSSWRWLQTLFLDLKNNSITRAFVTCEEGHVPIGIPDEQKFTDHMLLELQGSGEVIDNTTGTKYKSCSDTSLLMECRAVMMMDEKNAIIVSGNNEAVVGDFVRLYSNIQGVLPSRQRRMVFLKMPGFDTNPITANQHMDFTVKSPLD